MMIIIQNNEIVALSAPITAAEQSLLPLTHESGAVWWIVDAEGGEPFQASDGSIHLLRRRTEAEIRNLPAARARRAAEYKNTRQDRLLVPDYLITLIEDKMEEIYV